MMRAWLGDWRKRIVDRVRDVGFRSATEWIDAHPLRSLEDLANELGPEDVAADQLELTLREEAGHDPIALARLARSLLVRTILSKMPTGWGDHDQSVLVAASWAGCLGDEYDAAMERVLNKLDELAPFGWRPTTPDDPILLEAFRDWPA